MSKANQAVMWALLFASGASVATAQQPVTLTSSADFRRGNNEGLTTTAQDRVTRDLITAGTVGGWSSTTGLTGGRAGHCSIVYNGYAYVFSGGNDNFVRVTDVLFTSINADGSVGTWSSTTALPTGRDSFSCVAYNGFVYAIAGSDEPVGRLNEVLVAPINANGTLGTWTATTALPSARMRHAAVAYNGFLYVVGGEGDNVRLDDVLVSPINADGSIGDWSESTSLPSGRYFPTSVAYNGFIYCMGGFTDTGRTDQVLFASINADGTIGSWSATTALPSPRYSHSSVVYNGFLYTIGGEADSGRLSQVLIAAINTDGSVGTWSAATALSSGRQDHSSLVYNGFLYTIGGDDFAPGTLSAVLVAPINPDSGNSNQTPNRLRAFYSHLVDLQSDSPTHSIVLNGQTSPGGVVRLQVRVALAATAEFGAETVFDTASMGSPIQISGTGRYVWIRLTLDDTATTDAAQPTYVSDITISPGSTPSAGVVFDGPGADIDTQTSRTTIEANWTGFTATGGGGIAFYEWAIGTAPGQANIQDWVNVGLATSASNSSLSLGVGVTYYVRVRATSASGLTSSVATSDGVQVVAFPSSGPTDDGHKKKRCGFGASAASGSLAALLGGLALMAPALRRRGLRR